MRLARKLLSSALRRLDMNSFKRVVPALILAGGLWIAAKPSYAKPDYSKTEKKGCTYCHVAAGKKELNDAGNYYKDHNHSLEGYKPDKQ
jgi:hypothetical protein